MLCWCVGYAAGALVGSVLVCASVCPLHSVQACSGKLLIYMSGVEGVAAAAAAAAALWCVAAVKWAP
jgi:hypothetical protein